MTQCDRSEESKSIADRIAPPNSRAMKCCSWCKSSHHITIIITETELSSLANTCFCDNSCFEKFTSSVAAPKLQAIKNNFTQQKRCSLCNEVIRLIVTDDKNRVPGTFCSIECLQTLSIRVKKTIPTTPASDWYVRSKKKSASSTSHDEENADDSTFKNDSNGASTVSTGESTGSQLAIRCDTPKSDGKKLASKSSKKIDSKSVIGPSTKTHSSHAVSSISNEAAPVCSSPSPSSTKSRQPPTYHYETYSVFDWNSYLAEVGGEPAPSHCFHQNTNIPENEFQIDMKLEAIDPRNPSSLCLATVVALFGARIQLRLDGSDNSNDFWELVDSSNIHPIGYCEETGDMLQPPLGFRKNPAQWHVFLKEALKDAYHAPSSAFKKCPPKPARNTFKVGMKLEAVDRKNPRLICPATIGEVSSDTVYVTFDGWKGAFDYECDYSSRDLFPVGWCERSGHPLQPPGDKVPTQYSKAIMMSMSSNTGIHLAVKNGKGDLAVKTSEAKATKAYARTPRNQTAPSLNTKKSASSKPIEIEKAQSRTIILRPYIREVDNEGPAANGNGHSSPITASPVSSLPIKRSYNGSPAAADKSIKIKAIRLDEDDDCDEDAPADEETTEEKNASTKPTGNVREWSVDDVVNFLISSDQSLAPHTPMFRLHEIDGKALLLLSSDAMMKFMDLRLGPALKIYSLIDKLR